MLAIGEKFNEDGEICLKRMEAIECGEIVEEPESD
jgi:hypothetical protein